MDRRRIAAGCGGAAFDRPPLQRIRARGFVSGSEAYCLHKKEVAELEKTALVLAGGGSRGAYEIGVWRALTELDERFQMVTGSSVGAINGAVVAQGEFELAERMWKELETSRVFDLPLDETLPQKQKRRAAMRLFGLAAVREGGAGTGALAGLLAQYLDEEKVRQSPIDFGVIAVELGSMKPVYRWKDEIPSGRLADYLIASSSLFPAIRPHEIDGKKYIDGGFGDNMPVRMAAERGARRIIAVNMDAPGILHDDLPDDCELRIIRPYWDLGALLVFDPHSARQNLRLGYLDTMRSYGVFDGHAYTFVKGTISDEMQRYYGQFYARMDLLGFRNVRRRFLQSAAYAAVTRQVYRRSSRKTPVRAFALDGIESAAELLGLNPCVLYSADRLHERLSEAVQAVELPASLSGEGGAVPLGLSALADALRLADRPCRLRFLARTIRSALDRAEPVSLLPVAALLPGEFSAALYLAFSRIL